MLECSFHESLNDGNDLENDLSHVVVEAEAVGVEESHQGVLEDDKTLLNVEHHIWRNHWSECWLVLIEKRNTNGSSNVWSVYEVEGISSGEDVLKEEASAHNVEAGDDNVSYFPKVSVALIFSELRGLSLKHAAVGGKWYSQVGLKQLDQRLILSEQVVLLNLGRVWGCGLGGENCKGYCEECW